MTVIVCAAVTTRLTGTVTVGVAEFWNVSTMLLVYVPGDREFCRMLAEMLPVVAVAVPLKGVTCSQVPPVTGTTCAVKVVLPPVAVKFTVCAAGSVVAFCVCENARDVGATVTVVLAETVNTTGMVSAPLGRFEPFCAEIVIDPVYVPTGNPLGAICTCRYCCVVPEEEPRNSQVVGAFGVDAVAENRSADPSVLLMEIWLEISALDPEVAVTTPKPNGGVTVNSGVAAISTVTGMITVALALVPLL